VIDAPPSETGAAKLTDSWPEPATLLLVIAGVLGVVARVADCRVEPAPMTLSARTLTEYVVPLVRPETTLALALVRLELPALTDHGRAAGGCALAERHRQCAVSRRDRADHRGRRRPDLRDDARRRRERALAGAALPTSFRAWCCCPCTRQASPDLPGSAHRLCGWVRSGRRSRRRCRGHTPRRR
jgi:hypothetical protein